MAVTLWKLAKAWTDFCQFWKTKSVSSSTGDATSAVIQIPRKGFVKGVYLEVQTAYTAASSGSVTVGFTAPDKTEDADYFFDNTAAAPLTKGVKKSATSMYFEKGGLLTVTFAKGDSAADAVVRVFADIATVY